MPYADTSSGRLYYEVVDHVVPWETRRETILLHHGIGASAGIWAEWLPGLMDRYRIVTFDMRGYGRSEIPPAHFSPYGFRDFRPAGKYRTIVKTAGIKLE